jgi:hypothetical protein
MKHEVTELNQAKLEKELREILAPEELAGLAMKLRISISSLCDRLIDPRP